MLGALLRDPKAKRNAGVQFQPARYVLDFLMSPTVENQHHAQLRGGVTFLTPEQARQELRQRLTTAAGQQRSEPRVIVPER